MPDVGTQGSQQLYSNVLEAEALELTGYYFIAGGSMSVCLCCSHTSYFSVGPTVLKNGNMTSSFCYHRVLLMHGWGLWFDLPPSHSTLPLGTEALVAAYSSWLP